MSASTEAEKLRAAATAGPPKIESGFDPETGDLRIGEVTYKPRKFTNARRKEIRKLDEARDHAQHAAASIAIAGKFDLIDMPDGKGGTEKQPVLKDGQAPPTAEEMIAVQNASDELQDTLFYKLPVLFQADDGQRPSVEEAMEELTDAEAAAAVEFAQANPTDQKTGTTYA